MIDPNPPEGGSDVALFTLPPKATFRPVANHLLLDYQKPTNAGGIIIPQQARQLDTIVCEVLAIGPDVKAIKKGDRVVILAKALVGGTDGLMVEGRRVYFTQEQVVIAVVASPE